MGAVNSKHEIGCRTWDVLESNTDSDECKINKEMLVHGFIREIENVDFLFIPLNMIEMCCLFYSIALLKAYIILKIGNGGDIKISAGDLYKCSLDIDLKLLSIESQKWFGCIDIDSKKVIFQKKRVLIDDKGRHSHRWLLINNQKYFATQSATNAIKMFKVNKSNKITFKEDKSKTISLGNTDVINFVAFDKDFKNVFIVSNAIYFEKRSIQSTDFNEVLVRIKLEEEVHRSGLKQLTLSDDGTLCVIGAGMHKNYFFLIDITNEKQYKLSSNFIVHTYVPCFINSGTEYIAVANRKQNIEIWNVSKQKPIAEIDIGKDEYITCMTAANGMLAVGTWDKMLRLYDVRNWKVFFTQEYDVLPYSLHLTDDSKYLTIGGRGGYNAPKCVVVQIHCQ